MGHYFSGISKSESYFFFVILSFVIFFLLFRISIFLLDNTKKVDLIEMGTRPGLRSIPHISGILLLMQLLLLQPLVDAKAETSAAVDTRSAPASPARVTDFKQEIEAHEYRVSITFEGNPHHRGIEELVKVSTNGWNKTFSEPRDNTAKLKRTFKFVIPKEFRFHQFAIVFGKEVHIFQLKAKGFEKHAVYQKYIGLVNYLSEKVKYMMPDYGVGWMSQVVRKELDGWMSQVVRKELDNIIYTQTNLSDHLRQLKTDIESIKAKLPESFDGNNNNNALKKLQGETESEHEGSNINRGININIKINNPTSGFGGEGNLGYDSQNGGMGVGGATTSYYYYGDENEDGEEQIDGDENEDGDEQVDGDENEDGGGYGHRPSWAEIRREYVTDSQNGGGEQVDADENEDGEDEQVTTTSYYYYGNENEDGEEQVDGDENEDGVEQIDGNENEDGDEQVDGDENEDE